MPKGNRRNVRQSVYVIAAREAGPCKIGIAANPLARLRQLQTGHHERLALWLAVSSDYAERVERLAHASLTPYNLSGEWFSVPVADAIAIVQAKAAMIGRPETKIYAADLVHQKRLVYTIWRLYR